GPCQRTAQYAATRLAARREQHGLTIGHRHRLKSLLQRERAGKQREQTHALLAGEDRFQLLDVRATVPSPELKDHILQIRVARMQRELIDRLAEEPRLAGGLRGRILSRRLRARSA